MDAIKSYKGFNKDMSCTPKGGTIFQYEEGKEYETEKAVCCENGFHACETPLNVFSFYPPATSVYHEVEQSGDIDRGDHKTSSTKIKIGARIGIKDLVKAQIEFVFDKIKKEKAKSDKNLESAASSGRGSSAVTSGDWSSAASSGRGSSAVTSGSGSSAATSGSGSSAVTSGDWSSAASSGRGSSAVTSGDWSSAASSGRGSSAVTSGDWSSAVTSGDWSSAATSGSGSSAVTSGDWSSAATSNKNAVALACGKNARAKGVVGSYIVLTEWNDEADKLLNAQMVRIDGETYKPDMWYTIKGGKIVEAED